MSRVFGIPAGALTFWLVVALAVAAALLTAMAVRNWVFMKLGMRNMARRGGRSALIVFGLMLGTAIISSALNTGDTMHHTIRSTVLTSAGRIDEVVAPKGWKVGQREVSFFDASVYDTTRQAVGSSPLVDGIAPAIIVEVAAQDTTTRQTEPRVMMFASDPAQLGAFGTMTGRQRATVSLADLATGEVFINTKAATKLNAHVGDTVTLFAGREGSPMTVRDIVRYDGTGTDGAAVLVPLDRAQALLDRAGQINHVLISNAGGETSGVRHSDAVRALVDPALAPVGLAASPIKADGLKSADQLGTAFMTLFTTFGTFSMAAGVLLIFLIFVMLAAERRGEMGISRAIGTQRRHLVEWFVFEGVAYDLVAAAVGAVLGLAVAFGMVAVMARAFVGAGLHVRYSVQPRSFLIAFALGVLLTLAVVAVSAWRVSVLNVATAIRNLPDPLVRGTRRARWLRALIGLAVGVLITASGMATNQATPTLLGASIVIIALVPLVRTVGVNDRLAYTVGGLALIVLWILPFAWLNHIFGELRMNFSVWVVSGLMVVLGLTWTIMYNADLLLGAVMAVFGRVRRFAPVLRTSIAYPLRSRFRTGITLAMFTLVVFTLVVGSVTTQSFTNAFNNTKAYAGGFDVMATVSPASPITDIAGALRTTPDLGVHGIDASAFTVAASESLIGVDARQANASRDFASYTLRGLDDTFLASTTYSFAAIADGYTTAADVWRAMGANDNLAVVDSLTVPRKSNFSFAARPDFVVSGFYLEDKHFAPFPVEIRDPISRSVHRFIVVGVLRDSSIATMFGISVPQRSLSDFGDRARPFSYRFRTTPGTDNRATARALESAFLPSGMQADSVADLVHDATAASMVFTRLILGFIGLGLVVGVAALGVISARSVVERRQHIGVLRAIGFQSAMVKAGFLIEASFVALTAIVGGSVLGLIIGYNVVADQRRLPNYDQLPVAVPWLTLVVIFAVVYATALGATYVAARRGARIYPAAALRYQ